MERRIRNPRGLVALLLSAAMMTILLFASGPTMALAAPKTNSSSSVYGWGDTANGDYCYPATYPNPSTPQTVSSLSNATAIAASSGSGHTLALMNGSVYACGSNSSGQLGTAATTSNTSNGTPVSVKDSSGNPLNATAIAAGGQHSLALKSDGTVWAWGDNSKGQLGQDPTTTTSSYTPVQVPLPTTDSSGNAIKAVAISGNNQFSLALMSNNTVWAWGDNTYGQLGQDPTTTPSSYTPVQVPNLTNVTAIAAAGFHSLAVNNGTVYTWGDSYGQSSSTPVPVNDSNGNPLNNATAVAGGGGHSLALKSDGTVWAWGQNSEGQLGNGTTTPSSKAVQVSGLSSVTAIAAGQYHSMALASGGTVSTWGGGINGQLGIRKTPNAQTTPAPVKGLRNVKAITAGADWSMAMT